MVSKSGSKSGRCDTFTQVPGIEVKLEALPDGRVDVGYWKLVTKRVQEVLLPLSLPPSLSLTHTLSLSLSLSPSPSLPPSSSLSLSLSRSLALSLS